MRLSLPKAAAIFLLVGGIFTQGQAFMSFDPDQLGACEAAIGAAPSSDDYPALRGFAVRCADRDLALEKSEFAQLKRSSETAAKPERDAYTSLLAAFISFRTLHITVAAKGCGGGVGCSSEGEKEQAHINYQFLLMAEGFRQAGLATLSNLNSVAEDAALNAAYKRSLPNHPNPCPDDDDACVSANDFRAAERAWLRYRDAWLAYAAIKWPSVSADTWRAYLTHQRIQQLP
jgi:hypothetical protein